MIINSEAEVTRVYSWTDFTHDTDAGTAGKRRGKTDSMVLS